MVQEPTCTHAHKYSPNGASHFFFFFRAFTGDLVHNKEKGMYRCTVCGKELFLSDTKFDSGTGWPSFWDTSEDESIRRIVDTSHGMTRTEVTCANVSSSLAEGHYIFLVDMQSGQCILIIAYVPTVWVTVLINYSRTPLT